MSTRFLPEGYGSPELLAPLRTTLQALLTDPGTRLGVGVAVSGGADSAMWAVHAALRARDWPALQVHCFHIHHGLQAPADDWLTHVHALAQGLRLPCHSLRVCVETNTRKGTEAAAREARYAGLRQLALYAGVQHILLAHHLNDQTETVLFRLLRGAGPTGLGAMAPSTQRDGLIYLRPWLDVNRDVIKSAATDYARLSGWQHVDDPTNLQDAYARGAVRRRLVPVLDERWPAWRTTLSRHARQARELDALLHEVAEEDLKGLEPSSDFTSFSLAAWRKLSAARQAMVIRHWLAKHRLRAPTEARLRELCRQLADVHALGHDRALRMQHEGHDILCRKGRVLLLLQNHNRENR